MRAYERLLKYVTVHTTSDPKSAAVPTAERQFDLAKLLVEELKELGVSDARVDDKCYVYASIPAVPGCEDCKSIGFIAHMDTTPDFNGEGVKPQVIENYDGNDVRLGESGRVLKVSDFPHLAGLKGRTLITTDGTTLLGADDKAGVAAIMTVVEHLMREEIPHGKICIGFTPDEEVGRGADHFDVKAFGAEFAYTLDGGAEGEIEYENFNAAAADIQITGVNVHPGTAKNVMVNAAAVAIEFHQMLPAGQVPEKTEGKEGFYHLHSMEGDVEKAELHYIVRDHSRELFEAKKAAMLLNEKLLNEKYGAGTVQVNWTDQYRNMKEMVEPHMHLIDFAKEAVLEEGVEFEVVPIRGGTDGANLSFMGLPCPNLGTGGYAFHGPYEHATAEGMDHCVGIVLNVIRRYALQKR